ncbi:MAG TPA: C39 family peptidase [Brachybacterium paraconglomeratum]|uniref:C39 family peptidase n=1 Tax=Brachybacterium paraconglomeratum TaxID=173362 RepID=A0A921GPU4_9MICO|nr:C39 family peptidase [Brachybacterium paraconglomeratum]
MTTIAADRRTFLKTLGVTAAAGLATLAVAPRASAAQTVLPTTYQQQPNFFYCGPTAVAIALSAKVQPPSLDTLAAELATTDSGTNFGAVSPVLTARLPGATYRDQWMESTSASQADADLLWERATTNVDDGFATVCNWWVVAGEYPNWGGNTGDIFHFVTIDGYDAANRTLRIADPAGSTLSASLPSHHWLSVEQVATYCAGRGYFW